MRKKGRHNKEEYEVKKKRVTIRLNAGDEAVLKYLADLKNISISDYLRSLIIDDYHKNMF